MKTIILTIIAKLGLNKAILQLSFLFAFISTAVSEAIADKEPYTMLGITFFLWVVYIFTVFLDWAAGITAAKVLAKRKGENFEWDVDKSINNIYKHALFIMIIATVYFFQKEAVRKEFPEFLITLLHYIQFAYFAYNMINEWISIEKNRFKVTNSYSRLYKLLTRAMDLFDEAAINKVEKLTKTTENEVTK